MLKSNIKKFRQTFFNPRVFIYIFIGSGIIFFTFLTDNNALEIVISGLASVFIGIGVNNYSILDTREKDNLKIKSKIGHALKTMSIADSKIMRIQLNYSEGRHDEILDNLTELRQLMNLTEQLLQADAGS